MPGDNCLKFSTIIMATAFKGLSTQMRIRQRIESELGEFALNSNQARPHVIRIIVPHK